MLNSMKNFFSTRLRPNSSNNNFEELILPARIGLYSLYLKVKNDEEYTNVFELCKELIEKNPLSEKENMRLNNSLFYNDVDSKQISQTYLFFDYDGHNNHIGDGIIYNDVVNKMLELFDNETENGKLYVNYPMLESLRHFNNLQQCMQNNISCLTKVSDGKKYKQIVNAEGMSKDWSNFDLACWEWSLVLFLYRISCLFDVVGCIDFYEYKQLVNPLSLFKKQMEKHGIDTIMLISSLPAFIYDYFKEEQVFCYFEVASKKHINHCDFKGNQH